MGEKGEKATNVNRPPNGSCCPELGQQWVRTTQPKSGDEEKDNNIGLVWQIEISANRDSWRFAWTVDGEERYHASRMPDQQRPMSFRAKRSIEDGEGGFFSGSLHSNTPLAHLPEHGSVIGVL